MKKAKPFFLFLIVAFIISGIGFSGYKLAQFFIKPIEIEEETQENSQHSITTFFIPVTHFKSDKVAVSMDELKTMLQQGDLIVPLGQEALLTKLFNLTSITTQTLPIDQITPYLLQNKDTIALLPSDQVDFQVKTLKVDDQYFWDKTLDVKKYPLAVTELVSEDVQSTSRNLTQLWASGEIILARGVAERITKYHDVLYPFAKIKEPMADSDLRIATFEAPLAQECNYCDSCMVFCGELSYIDGVISANINAVSLAANHIRDYGAQGIEDTMTLLDQKNILHTGAGQNSAEARTPIITTVNGLKLGILGYNNVVPVEYAAETDYAGSAWMNEEEVVSDIKSLRPQVDILLLQMHWGVEYTNFPNDDQKNIAHSALDAGADLIIGDHPHWVQGIEFYKNKFIIYGVGNFVFDQMWSEETREAVSLKLHFNDAKLVNVELLPTKIDDYAQVRLATTDESKIILNRIFEASKFSPND